jgi:hypothetical protein
MSTLTDDQHSRLRLMGGTPLRIAIAIALSLVARGPAKAEEYVAVVSADNPTIELSLQTVRLLYGGYKRKWKDNRPVALILPPAGSPAMQFLVQRVFKVEDEAHVQRYYLEALFQQRLAVAPPQADASTALERVRGDARHIAVLARSDAREVSGCKVFQLGVLD